MTAVRLSLRSPYSVVVAAAEPRGEPIAGDASRATMPHTKRGVGEEGPTRPEASMPRSTSSTIAMWVIAGMLAGVIADVSLDEFPFYVGLGGLAGLLAGFLIAAWRK